jgi:hypothetical protein
MSDPAEKVAHLAEFYRNIIKQALDNPYEVSPPYLLAAMQILEQLRRLQL